MKPTVFILALFSVACTGRLEPPATESGCRVAVAYVNGYVELGNDASRGTYRRQHEHQMADGASFRITDIEGGEALVRCTGTTMHVQHDGRNMVAERGGTIVFRERLFTEEEAREFFTDAVFSTGKEGEDG
jgi:hypothetical protein